MSLTNTSVVYFFISTAIISILFLVKAILIISDKCTENLLKIVMNPYPLHADGTQETRVYME